MCEPISIAIGTISAVLGVTEAIVGGVNQQKQSQEMANMAAQQAAAYNKLAQDTEQQGQWEKRELALEQKSKHATMLANAASRGTLIGTGSNLTIEEDLAQSADYEQKQKDYDIASRKYQYQMQEYNALMSEANYKAQANNATWSMIGGATKGILGGVTSGLGVYGALGEVGGFGSDDLSYNFFG